PPAGRRVPHPRFLGWVLKLGFLPSHHFNRATITVISSACSALPAHSSAAVINDSATLLGDDACTRTAASCNLRIPNSSPYTFSGSTSPSLYPTSIASRGTISEFSSYVQS